MTLKNAIESTKQFKLPESTEWLTINAEDKIVNARTGALVNIKASDMVRSDWDVKAKKLADTRIVAATPLGVYNFLNGRIVVIYTGTVPSTFNISVKEV